MHVRYFLVAGGNSTALVWNCPKTDRLSVAYTLMKQVEQVGFVHIDGIPHLTMMGEELCINALTACAYATEKQTGTLTTNTTDRPISYKINHELVTLEIALTVTKEGKLIRLKDIGYLCITENENLPTDTVLKKLAHDYNLPAFGAVRYGEKIPIQPYVYVCATDTCVKETSCGSGSIAIHCITGKSSIMQPTGEHIIVSEKQGSYTITTRVSEYML